ncbi:hypothetical protein Golob_017801 [Gossypium lobatum]|uniref:Zinc knuckle CX2CX4HX4C domain-containing protein n=1 Tax=Gossypium lobatum TaxID=34289 RepID=A0A7J8M883_9ROSI|nr:hypothetical protein [Gossypium lobatum]
MVKLDVHTDCARKERFEQLAVCVDLRKPLVAMIRINGHLQQVECEALPNICFKCGLYRHGADLCSGVKTTSPTVDSDCVSPMMDKSGIKRRVKEEPFGHWMVVKRLKRRSRVIGDERNDGFSDAFGGSQHLEILGEKISLMLMGRLMTKWKKEIRGRPPDEMMENHLCDLVELKSAMEGLVCDLERTSKKTLMEGGSQIVEERIVVEDTWNDE